jgi:hypothetical protein
VNYFNYSNPIDNNNDNFTDVTCKNAFFQNGILIEKNKQLSQVGYFMKIAGEVKCSGEKNIEVAMKCTEAFTLNDGNYLELMNCHREKCFFLFLYRP